MENKIENYLSLAQMAFDGSNYVECDNYVSKELEIDSTNTDVYLLKINSLLIGLNLSEKRNWTNWYVSYTIQVMKTPDITINRKGNCYGTNKKHND